MDIIAKVGEALQQVFGKIAESAGRASGVIKRKRKFDSMSLVRTFVLGFLQNPDATDEQLAQMAAQCGVEVTPQAIDQRHTSKLRECLEKVFRESVTHIVGSGKALAPILERFTSVVLLDSTTIALPDEMQEKFPGCGGSYDSGAAAMKLQTEFDLKGGALSCVEIEAGRSPDGASSRQDVRRGEGSLRIADLGYFKVDVFAAMTTNKEYFLSRLQFNTTVLKPNGEEIDLLPWLEENVNGFVDQPILLSKSVGLSCRLIAWRVPEEQANERRRKLRQEMKKKMGKNQVRNAWRGVIGASW